MNRTVGNEPTSKIQRMVTAAFGVFFVVMAIAIVLLVEGSLHVGAVLAALALAILGVDACLSAARGKRSLLERIGPLP